MHVFNETVLTGQSTFERHVLDENGNSLSSNSSTIPLHSIVVDRKSIYLLYDDDMNVISTAYVYLNHDKMGSAPNSRKQAAYALRFLYCFLCASDLALEDVDDSTLIELRQFLLGTGIASYGYGLKTRRRAATVNIYFAVYRDYFCSLGIKCEALYRSRTIYELADGTNYSGVRIERKHYVNNAPSSHRYDAQIPKYISPEDFRLLYRLALDAGDELSLILMRLMYEYGFRLGELLGLTLEDILEIEVSGSYKPVFILRNRLSDKRHQHAKGCRFSLLNETDYSTKDYRDSWATVVITYEAYEQVVAYIEQAHAVAKARYPENYAKGVADLVSDRGELTENHYVFLNRYGRTLDEQTWGRMLKSYFEKTGLALDWDTRRNNLSHRFRHGFAMFHAHFSPEPLGILELQKMMRHKSLSSTMVYYNPTLEDQFKMKTLFQQNIYEAIPELEARFDDRF